MPAIRFQNGLIACPTALRHHLPRSARCCGCPRCESTACRDCGRPRSDRPIAGCSHRRWGAHFQKCRAALWPVTDRHGCARPRSRRHSPSVRHRRRGLSMPHSHAAHAGHVPHGTHVGRSFVGFPDISIIPSCDMDMSHDGPDTARCRTSGSVILFLDARQCAFWQWA